MRVGKLTSEELQRLVISKTSTKNKEVLLSAGLAEDCSAVKTDDIILLTTDPITCAGANSGRLAITVSANDVAVSGGTPYACLLTIIAPSNSSLTEIADIMSEAQSEAEALNIDIIGGHTEFSEAVNKTILSCVMLGKCKKIIKTGSALCGDSIVMTKSAGLEGTAIMAADFRKKLLNCGLTEAELSEAENYIERVCVMKEASVAAKLGVHSMHDITEGGVYGAISEMAEASSLGATVYADKIPVSRITEKICAALGVNPMRLISSGSILITTDNPVTLISELASVGVQAAVIGEMHGDKNEVIAIAGGTAEKLTVTADELLSIK